MFFFALSLIYTKDFRFSLAGTDQFIAGDFTKESPLHLVDYQNSTLFTIRSDADLPEQVNLTLSFFPSIAIKLDTTHNYYVYSPFTRHSTFNFMIVPLNFYDKTYWILDNNKECLSWNANTFIFEPRRCEINDKTQRFTIESYDITDDKMKTCTLNATEISNIKLKSAEHSHQLEISGESLIASIFAIINGIEVCLLRSGSCGKFEEAMKFYASGKKMTRAGKKSYKSSKSVRSSSMSSASSSSASGSYASRSG